MAKLRNPEREPVASTSPGEDSLSIIARGMRIVGDLKTEGVIKIEGEVSGTINAGRQVLVGQSGRVDGDIATREAIIGGQVSGSIVAQERVEIQASSTVDGDIITKRVVVAEGGQVNGSVQMGDPATLKGAKPAPRDTSSGASAPIAAAAR